MDSYHHGNLRADLVALARTYIEGDDSGDLPSLRELARQAHVSPTAVYHHFQSKEDLLAEVAVAILEDLLEAWRGLSLEELGPAYLEYFRKRPPALELLFGSRVRSNSRVRLLQDRAYGVLVDKLPRLPDGEPDHLAGLALWAVVQGLAQLYSSGALGADPVECPGAPDLWYQNPPTVMEALAPLLERLTRVRPPVG